MIPWLYKWLPIVFGCHCRPDRSFYWKGKKFPLCARCTGELAGKKLDARRSLLYADNYMAELGKAFERLNRTKVTDRQVLDYINCLFPDMENMTAVQQKNISRMKEELKTRYFDAPDLKGMEKSGYRFINAVSDFATHAKPLRETKNYRENLFGRTMEGNALIDRAYDMICAA